MHHKRPAPPFSYGIALALPCFTTLLAKYLGVAKFILGAVAVLLSAWYGGLLPGLISSVVAMVTISYFLLPASPPSGLWTLENSFRFGFFALLSMLISSIMETRYKAEHALSEVQRLLSNVLDSSPMPIAVSTPNGHYILVNQAWKKAKMNQRHAALVRLEDARWVFHADKLMSPLGDASDALVQSMITEEVIDTPEGPRHYQTCKFPVLDRDGNIEAQCTISFDISEVSKAGEPIREQQ